LEAEYHSSSVASLIPKDHMTPDRDVPAVGIQPRVFLCDLTYTQQTIASDIMPAAVAGIATFLQSNYPGGCDVSIFKYPDSFIKALESIVPGKEPHIVGFSNYCWNCNLSVAFAEVIKARFPSVIIVFGGPNLPHDQNEQEEFLLNHPVVDFHIVKEGEIGFFYLVRRLAENNYLKESVSSEIPNLIFIDASRKFHASPKLERVTDLNLIPSPYIEGLLDPFFDGIMLPIIQTNRGCPFTCTFCTEGMSYWNKVNKHRESKVEEEIRYIAFKMSLLGENARRDLHIADSNFGMFEEDVDVARTLADVRKEFNYPQYINVATGKNKKERVLEVAKIVDGAMKLAGSVQSLNKNVLENIKRSNISVPQIIELALRANEIGANSYSEIILALPGDTLEAHFESLRIIVEAGFNTIAMYQLMILPGTEMGSRPSRETYQMQTRYRLLPRCYGYFDVLGKSINVAEIEEICVANSTLSFQDYLSCRKMDLLTNVFYNDGVFRELIRFLKSLGLSTCDWLQLIYEGVGQSEAFNELISEFLFETEHELYGDKSALAELVTDREFLVKVIAGEVGGNLMFKYKGLSITHYLNAIARTAEEAVFELLRRKNMATEENISFASEIIRFNVLRMEDIFIDEPQNKQGVFSNDIAAFASDEGKSVEDCRMPGKIRIYFEFSEDQHKTLKNYLTIFGNTKTGISRILSRVYIRKVFRNPRSESGHEVAESAKTFLTGQASLTGMNEFE
jgi:radical SAM superfamily enzyme YgiQ (UPF0313 family)